MRAARIGQDRHRGPAIDGGFVLSDPHRGIFALDLDWNSRRRGDDGENQKTQNLHDIFRGVGTAGVIWLGAVEDLRIQATAIHLKYSRCDSVVGEALDLEMALPGGRFSVTDPVALVFQLGDELEPLFFVVNGYP